MLALEVIVLPVMHVDRALAFYTEQVGFTLDVDYRPTPEFRVVQLTPAGSSCSIQLIDTDLHGPMYNLYLVTNDLVAEREKLVGRGADVGAVRHKDTVEAWTGGWSAGVGSPPSRLCKFRGLHRP
jgi:predicted enzyme related to lactoylglutathione lyase